MKAQKIRPEDHDLAFPQEMVAHSQQGKLKEHASALKDQLSQRDIEVVRRSLEHLKMRNERIEALKVQVNAGTYQMNSTNIAHKMVSSPLARKVLDTGRYNILSFKDDD